jgi:hypothetical protein
MLSDRQFTASSEAFKAGMAFAKITSHFALILNKLDITFFERKKKREHTQKIIFTLHTFPKQH